MPLPDDTVLGGPSRGFPSTHWSVLSSLQDRRDPQWEARVGALAKTYWKPIYRHIRLSWKQGNEEAKDLTQAFFVHILEGKFLAEASQSKGRFRAFVKACLENFLRQQHRDAGRLKRGGGKAALSLDMSDDEPLEVASAAPGPEEVLDREWKKALLNEAVGRLRDAYAREGKQVYFEVFRRYDLADAAERPSYRQLTEELKLGGSDIDNYLAHARARLHEMVRALVAESVADEEALSAEMRELFPAK